MKGKEYISYISCCPFFGCSIFCLIMCLAIFVFLFTFVLTMVFCSPGNFLVLPIVIPSSVLILFPILFLCTVCVGGGCGCVVSFQMSRMRYNVKKMSRMKLDELKPIMFPFVEINSLSDEMTYLVDKLMEIRALLPDNIFDTDIEEEVEEEDSEDSKEKDDTSKKKSSDYSMKIFGYSKYMKFGKSAVSIDSTNNMDNEPPSPLSSFRSTPSDGSLDHRIGTGPLSPSGSGSMYGSQYGSQEGGSFFHRIRKISVTSLGSSTKRSSSSVFSMSSAEDNEEKKNDGETLTNGLVLHLLPHSVSVVSLKIGGMEKLIGTELLENVVGLYEDIFGSVWKSSKKFRGTVVNFSLDSIVIFFGGRRNNRNKHGVLACCTALQIQKELKDINRRLEASGGESLNFGIGVSQGDGLVGLIGSREKMRVSLYGKLVQFSEFLAKQKLKRFNGSDSCILVSESVISSLPHLEFTYYNCDIVMYQRERKDIFLLIQRNDVNKDDEWMYELENQEEGKKNMDIQLAFAHILKSEFDKAKAILNSEKYKDNVITKRFVDILEHSIENGVDFDTIYGENVSRVLMFEETADFFSLFPQIQLKSTINLKSLDEDEESGEEGSGSGSGEENDKEFGTLFNENIQRIKEDSSSENDGESNFSPEEGGEVDGTISTNSNGNGEILVD